MSAKNIYFFENGSAEKLEPLYKKYAGLSVRELPQCLLPQGMSGFSAYTLDDLHENSGISVSALNSPRFRQMFESFSESGHKMNIHSFDSDEEREKCALEIKHMIYEMILLCGIGCVGVTAVFLSDDAWKTEIDLRGSGIKQTDVWSLRAGDLLELGSGVILRVNEHFGL